jgi:hypothetical protein
MACDHHPLDRIVRRCLHHIQKWEDRKIFHLGEPLVIELQDHRRKLCELVEQQEDHQADPGLAEN